MREGGSVVRLRSSIAKPESLRRPNRWRLIALLVAVAVLPLLLFQCTGSDPETPPDSVTEPVTTPSVTEPVTPSVTEPVTPSVTEPVTASVTEPVTTPSMTTATDKATTVKPIIDGGNSLPPDEGFNPW